MEEVVNVQKNKNENLAFRYLYGFAILFVVLSHCDGGGFEMLSNWMHFGAFHLAIFVFGSGYFVKASDYSTPGKFLWKKIKKLLIPLWIWNLIYGIILVILHKVGFTFDSMVNLKTILIGPINSKDLFILNMGSWFLFPFFMVQLIYMLGKCLLDLWKEEKVTDFILEVVLFASGIFCVYLINHGIWSEQLLFLFRAMYFLPFYILGMWYKKYFEKQLDKLPKPCILTGCLVITLLLNTYFGRVVYAIPSSCDYPFGVIATFVSAFVGIFFWLTIAKALAMSEKKISALYLLGNRTWDIMFHQFAGILLVKTIFMMCNRCFGIFADFDYMSYHENIWYLYIPKGIAEYKALYVFGAVIFSVLVGKFVGILKKKFSFNV